MKPLSRNGIAWRAAQDLLDGMYVNLGIGVPVLVPPHIPKDREVILHSENGMLGFTALAKGETVDPDLVNAAKEPVRLVPGGAFFDHVLSFTMIRGGHLDVALLGAFEVSETGDLANWTVEDSGRAPGVGGAMDLAVGAREVRVMMEHTTREGTPRIRKSCRYPLTATGVVRRVYSDLAVLDVVGGGLLVREMVEGMTFEELCRRTEAKLDLAPDCRPLNAPVA